MPIDAQEIRKIASLAKLRLGERELQGLEEQFRAILEMVGQLSELSSEGLGQLAHQEVPLEWLREDRVGGSLRPEEALSNAPRGDGECFRVPPVLGGDP
jgi:aspartyl-tRNA(Asn)/glutamyl-tRNA(Gln) amidotransferase subunit C